MGRKRSENELMVQDTRERMNLLESEIAQEEIAMESFKAKIISYGQLKTLTEKLGTCLTLDDTSSVLLYEVNKLFGDQETTIILYGFESTTGDLGLSLSQKGEMTINLKAKKGDLFDQWIVKTMKPLLVEDSKSDFRFDADQIVTEDHRNIGSLMSVPVMVSDKALGILRVDHPKTNHFTTEDLRFLTTVADLGAVAIENAQLYERVQELAIKDSLTNLYLRRYMLERLPEEISRHMRSKGSLSFLMIDLDYFKKYNDQYGHTAGDLVLKGVARRLLDLFNQPGNLVCRYGGEEFCVVLPDCSKADALKIASKLREIVETQSMTLRRQATNVTLSIGVATFPKDAQTKEELISKADQALYKAKQEGRNKVVGA